MVTRSDQLTRVFVEPYYWTLSTCQTLETRKARTDGDGNSSNIRNDSISFPSCRTYWASRLSRSLSFLSGPQQIDEKVSTTVYYSQLSPAIIVISMHCISLDRHGNNRARVSHGATECIVYKSQPAARRFTSDTHIRTASLMKERQVLIFVRVGFQSVKHCDSGSALFFVRSYKGLFIWVVRAWGKAKAQNEWPWELSPSAATLRRPKRRKK